VKRPRVLVVTNYYPPVIRGGAVRALADMISELRDRVSFYVRARDHDAVTGARGAVPASDRWIEADGVHVLYSSLARVDPFAIRDDVREIEPAAVYTNSLFATPTQSALLARRLGWLKGAKMIIAPEGELSPGALAQKYVKKQFYLHATRATGFFEGIVWHSITPLEKGHIRAIIPRADPACIGRAIKSGHGTPKGQVRTPKQTGRLRMLFLSRISPKKNLPFALRLLAKCQSGTAMKIVGPIEDKALWDECLSIIRQLPEGVSATYAGECEPDKVSSFYDRADVFLFPTLGENYGYVIEDALSCACVPVISDQTPWNGIAAAGAGFVFPLTDPDLWLDCLKKLHAMTEQEFAVLRNRCAGFVSTRHGDSAPLEQYLALLGFPLEE
jgi:glycosyltransferase involved in cell wall biosynthesis